MYRLLIVDADQDVCEQICGLVNWEAYGFNGVVTAGTYADAANIALDLQPHVALVDTALDEHSGCMLVEQLRSTGLRTVFAMMSRQRDPETVRACMHAGARDFLMKPLERRPLQEFAEWVVGSQLGGELPEKEMTDSEADPVLQVEYASLSKITNKILLIVRSDYHRSLSLTGIAETLHMSNKYIGRIFLKDTGMRFTEYLMAYRMLEAKKLILGTGEKISVIAGMVGYSQLNNFYTNFRSFFGVSPSSLRNFDPASEPDPVP